MRSPPTLPSPASPRRPRSMSPSAPQPVGWGESLEDIIAQVRSKEPVRPRNVLRKSRVAQRVVSQAGAMVNGRSRTRGSYLFNLMYTAPSVVVHPRTTAPQGRSKQYDMHTGLRKRSAKMTSLASIIAAGLYSPCMDLSGT